MTNNWFQVFLIIQSSSLVTKLAHVILCGDLSQGFQEVSHHRYCLFDVSLANQSTDSDSRVFLPPDVNLETKFRQPPAKGYIPAQRTMPKRFITLASEAV